MREHWAIGHTVDFTHQLHSDLWFAIVLSIPQVSQSNQSIKRVHFLLASFNTSNDCILLCIREVLTFNHRLAQSIHSSNDFWILEVGFDLLQRSFISLLVGLYTQAFTNAKCQGLNRSSVTHLYLRFPFRTGNQEAMELRSLGIDHVGFDTNTVLLPDAVLKVDWCIRIM